MRIAITGGTGSLGSALIRRLAQDGAERIVTFSRDEQRRLALAAQYAWHPGVKIYAGDIRDTARMPDLFRGCEVVIHAAARKVVSGHHDEPREMLLTNVLGTANVLAAAREAGVRKLLVISSDKAVHAENCYGMSKALAEQISLSENARCWAQGLRIAVMRYGNVLASNGSVLKVWRPLALRGQPFPLTNTGMTRFWLTLDDAVGYVLRAIADMRGGEIFVPILKAAPLVDVGQALVSVGSPEFDMTGIRPGGEKLYEELLSADEARRTVKRNGFYVVTPARTPDMWDPSTWLGDPVDRDFEYRSDRWPLRWTVDELRATIGGLA